MAELVKAMLVTERGKEIPCLYNPETLTMSRKNRWDSTPMPGKGVPGLSYTGASSGTMSLDLVFDTTSDGSPVTKYTGEILKLMDIDPDLPGHNEATNNARPPSVTFQWGKMNSFAAVVEDLQLTFTYFSSSGVPLRAKMQLRLTQFADPNKAAKQNPTSGTPKPSRTHRVQPGETLDRISARYYGDSTRWRVLASANGLEDPLAVRPGTLLDIPKMEG